jgi:hypothetical protein
MAEARKVADQTLRDNRDSARRKVAELVRDGLPKTMAQRQVAEHWLARGYNKTQVAGFLEVGLRRLRQIMQEDVNPDGVGFRVIQQAPVTDIDPRFLPMLEFTATGFRLFYEEFAGAELPEHCQGWVADFVEHRNLMLHVPPRHMKTTVFSIWIPIWFLCGAGKYDGHERTGRNEKIIILSKTDQFARDQTYKIANILETNTRLISAFGQFKPAKQGEAAWRPGQGELMVIGSQLEVGSGQFSVESRGMRQQILGREATLVVVDDPTDVQISKSEEQRKTALEKIRQEAMSRLMPGGHAVIIGQRVHWKDIYGELQKQRYERGPKLGERLWTVVNQPAIYRWENEDPEHPEPIVLWPDVWSFDELMIQYERVGGYGTFECMYQQNPLPESESYVKPHWWEGCQDLDRRAYEGIRGEGRPYTRVISIDPGVKHFHALTVADVDPSGERFAASILEMKNWKGGPRSILLELQRTIMQYRPDYVVMERVSFTEWLKEDPTYQQLKEKARFIPHTTGVNRGDSERGVESLAHEIEFGLVRFPCADEIGRDMMQLFRGEFEDFPYGEHDDVVMTLWFLKWNWRKFQNLDFLREQTPARRAGGWRADLKKRMDARNRALGLRRAS